MTDETTKQGTHYMGVEAADPTGKLWVMGLREIETKSGQDTLNIFKEILSDLDHISQKKSSNKIIKHIVATMSDRAATEVKFNELLEEFRSTILPLVIENYDQLSPEEQQSIEKLSNFFCGLHALVNFAKSAQRWRLKKVCFQKGHPYLINLSTHQQSQDPAGLSELPARLLQQEQTRKVDALALSQSSQRLS